MKKKPTKSRLAAIVAKLESLHTASLDYSAVVYDESLYGIGETKAKAIADIQKQHPYVNFGDCAFYKLTEDQWERVNKPNLTSKAFHAIINEV